MLLHVRLLLYCAPFFRTGHRMKRIPEGECLRRKENSFVAYMKKHCSCGCSGCNNGYAQVGDIYNSCNSSSCSSCGHHHGSGCNHNHGCSSCGSGCNSCNRSNNFGALRSVSGPFSNCGNWWNSDPNFPYYTGPCGPCDSCEQCCCKEWPWPWPPMPPVMPVNSGYVYSTPNSRNTAYSTGSNSGCSGGYNTDCSDDCGHHHYASDTGYTSHKNCYRTKESGNDAYAARQAKPIVDCGSCKQRCDCDN